MIGQLLLPQLQSDGDRRFAGIKFYSPAALLAFALIASLPVASTLFALNLRRRGRYALSCTFFVLSLVVVAAMVSYGFFVAAPRNLRFFHLAGGLLIFGAEKYTFAAAMQGGSIRARWWPPVLVFLGLLAVMVAATYALTS